MTSHEMRSSALTKSSPLPPTRLPTPRGASLLTSQPPNKPCCCNKYGLMIIRCGAEVGENLKRASAGLGERGAAFPPKQHWVIGSCRSSPGCAGCHHSRWWPRVCHPRPRSGGCRGQCEMLVGSVDGYRCWRCLCYCWATAVEAFLSQSPSPSP